ncbi:MAG: hypothetical protein EOM51_06595 [Clostridia bacterium]|nr:hypothetical protein [Clostridia bacterium]
MSKGAALLKNKKRILLYAVNALLLILIGACLLRAGSYSRILLSQQASKYWAGESKERFAQLSCFFPVGSEVSAETINAFRKGIDGKLVDAGLEPKTEGESWTDCYSAVGSLTVSGDRDSSEATAIGVDGDFFLFHPYELLSGSFISEDDLMKDRVVLDYELAWKLFGGTSLEGMTVTIGGAPYYVAGVVRRETDKFSNKAFSGEPVIFMHYSTFASLQETTSISCYEVAMPDPISNFGENLLTESFKTQKAVVVENSTRYSLPAIYGIFKNFGDRSMATTGVIYPYWENAARVSEDYVARLCLIAVLLGIFPFICLVILAVKFIRLLVAKLKILKFELWDAWDDRYARREAWKERRIQKRRDKTLRRHFEKPALKFHKRGKASEETQDNSEKELQLDIESIVREIMESPEGSDLKQ